MLRPMEEEEDEQQEKEEEEEEEEKLEKPQCKLTVYGIVNTSQVWTNH